MMNSLDPQRLLPRERSSSRLRATKVLPVRLAEGLSSSRKVARVDSDRSASFDI